MQRISNFFSPKHPTLIFPSYLLQKNMELHMQFFRCFCLLLKDLTAGGVNRNLAVVPGTNIPVSVETIRDNTYNSNCPSANPSYFGAYNLSGFGPAINFNGQTVEMLASASGLDITHTYRIIADGKAIM
jgi:hypothetical protein